MPSGATRTRLRVDRCKSAVRWEGGGWPLYSEEKRMSTTNRSNTSLHALVCVAIISGLLATAGCSSALSQPEVAAWLQFRTEPGADRAIADEQKKSMLKLLTSPFVLASALKQPGVAELETVRDQKDPVMWLSRSLEVVAQADSEVVKVRLRGQRPADLAKIVNAVTAVFLEDVVNMDRVAALGMRQAIEKKYKENQAELRVLREQAIKLAAMVEGPDAVDAKWAERELDALSGELSGVRSALRTVTADIAVATSTGEPVDPKLEAKKKVLGEQASALVAEMDAIRTKARDLAQARVDLEARRRSVESLQRVTDQLGLQLEATAVELNAPLRVRLVEEATAPAGAGP